MAHRTSSRPLNKNIYAGGLSGEDTKKPDREESYHGAGAVHKIVRGVLGSCSAGDNMPMSAKIMVGILCRSGLFDTMAKRMYHFLKCGLPL